MNILHTLLEWIGNGLLATGIFFMFVASVGIIRMPDFYNRLQASTKASTLGVMSIVLGVGFLHPDWLPKCFLLTVFILITNPLSSSVLGRASYRSGVPLCDSTKVDHCRDLAKKREES